MLPDGWRRLQVADICTMLNGRGFGPEDWKTEGLPIIRIQNLNGGTKFDYYSGPVDSRWLVEAGQLLFAWAGTKGVSFGPTIWRGETGVLNQHIFKVLARPGIDSRWLLLALRQVTDRIETAAHGFKATLVHVKKSDIDRQEVVVPPIENQRRLADVIDVWDEAIASTEQLLRNSRQQRHSLALALLGLATVDPLGQDRSSGYPPSVQPGIPSLPPTPPGWTCTSLDRHLHEVRRPVTLQPNLWYRLVTVKRSRGGVELREELAGEDIKTPTQFYVRTGDFLISKRQIVHGACGLVPAALDGAVVSNEYAVLNSDGKVDLQFLRYLSETRYFQQTCFHSSTGVHVEKMIFKTDHWLKWPFNIPPLEEQKRIIEVLDAAWREMALIEQQVAKLKQEKAALMADLLTGRRRIRAADAEATT